MLNNIYLVWESSQNLKYIHHFYIDQLNYSRMVSPLKLLVPSIGSIYHLYSELVILSFFLTNYIVLWKIFLNIISNNIFDSIFFCNRINLKIFFCFIFCVYLIFCIKALVLLVIKIGFKKFFVILAI